MNFEKFVSSVTSAAPAPYKMNRIADFGKVVVNLGQENFRIFKTFSPYNLDS
ncbi:hypothetical protein LEP1GSC052_2600 [Leptospira kmetyi serovar Malaysia str. Bejo-Iso9]|nr:hypothetical protein LEP1GSC052_2600 [Leptospira kmetyi serovar Malaysia str. Bejo-Iso9]